MKKAFILFLSLLIAGVFLFSASITVDRIHVARENMGLVSNTALENAPPALAFATVAMGAFRGLVVDVLWIRADKLKEEGQFFDAKQLAEWITIMQPRFASVWDFQAWNMAYNISVAMPASQCQERWHWVKAGYELLRDRGIPLNPDSIELYRSLAWIFQHKIGGITDDCHKYYRLEIARQFRFLLGENPSHEYFKRLSDAPEKVDVLLNDGDVLAFINALAEADDNFGDKDELVDNYLSLKQEPARFREEAFDVIDQYRGSKALDKFDIFAKAYKLRNKWKLDPDYMSKLNYMYGPVSYEDPNEHLPLNWEHPQVHAIYWANLGLERAGGKNEEYVINEKNTDRIVSHSLQNLFRQGRIVIYSIPGEADSLFLLPELRFFDVVNRDWMQRIDKYEKLDGTRPTGMRDGHRNFLINAVFSFYQSGKIARSGEIYQQLRSMYPRDEFKQSLVSFVKERLKEEIGSVSIYDATEMIMFSLQEAYFRYAVHDDQEAFSRESWARQVYEIYVQEFGDEEVRRVDLPEFSHMRFQAFLRFINDPFYPEHLRKNLVGRIKVERPELYEKIEKYVQQLQERQERLQNEREKAGQQ